MKSQQTASSSPPPNATPSTSGNRRLAAMREAVEQQRIAVRVAPAMRSADPRFADNSLRSNPAQNAFGPSPRRTIARIRVVLFEGLKLRGEFRTHRGIERVHRRRGDRHGRDRSDISTTIRPMWRSFGGDP